MLVLPDQFSRSLHNSNLISALSKSLSESLGVSLHFYCHSTSSVGGWVTIRYISAVVIVPHWCTCLETDWQAAWRLTVWEFNVHCIDQTATLALLGVWAMNSQLATLLNSQWLVLNNVKLFTSLIYVFATKQTLQQTLQQTVRDSLCGNSLTCPCYLTINLSSSS